MAELKGAAADRFIRNPDPQWPIVLIHGPDRGRVQTRAKDLIAALLGDNADPMACVELDPAVLDSEPARIAEEADSLSMFGGQKVVFARLDDPKSIVKPIQTLLDLPPTASTVVIASGDLKKSHPLRSRIEKAQNAVSIACYAAERKDIAALLASTAESYGLSIDAQTRDHVLAWLGADHALSANEIEKLCLYAKSDGHINSDHVSAIMTDSAAHGFSDVADMAFAGKREAALIALKHALADGMEASVLAQTVLHHAQNLERMRIEIDNGSTIDAVIGRTRPMIFFKRRPIVEKALRFWRSADLRRSTAQLDDELTAMRLDPALKTVRLERQVLRIASLARARQ